MLSEVAGMPTGDGSLEEAVLAARKALRQQLPGTAVSGLRAYLTRNGGDGEAWEMLGVACAVANDGRGAREAFNKATEVEPGRASAHYNYAIFLSMAGDLDAAVEHNAAALYLAPGHSGAAALQQQLAKRLRDRERTSEEGFRIVQSTHDPIHRPSPDWARLPCPACGTMNFVTARVCHRCQNYITEMSAPEPVE